MKSLEKQLDNGFDSVSAKTFQEIIAKVRKIDGSWQRFINRLDGLVYLQVTTLWVFALKVLWSWGRRDLRSSLT